MCASLLGVCLLSASVFTRVMCLPVLCVCCVCICAMCVSVLYMRLLPSMSCAVYLRVRLLCAHLCCVNWIWCP